MCHGVGDARAVVHSPRHDAEGQGRATGHRTRSAGLETGEARRRTSCSPQPLGTFGGGGLEKGGSSVRAPDVALGESPSPKAPRPKAPQNPPSVAHQRPSVHRQCPSAGAPSRLRDPSAARSSLPLCPPPPRSELSSSASGGLGGPGGAGRGDLLRPGPGRSGPCPHPIACVLSAPSIFCSRGTEGAGGGGGRVSPKCCCSCSSRKTHKNRVLHDRPGGGRMLDHRAGEGGGGGHTGRGERCEGGRTVRGPGRGGALLREAQGRR